MGNRCEFATLLEIRVSRGPSPRMTELNERTEARRKAL